MRAVLGASASCMIFASTLMKIMQDNDAPKTARIRAAEVILEHDRKGVVEEDLLVRVQALEEQLHAAQSS